MAYAVKSDLLKAIPEPSLLQLVDDEGYGWGAVKVPAASVADFQAGEQVSGAAGASGKVHSVENTTGGAGFLILVGVSGSFSKGDPLIGADSGASTEVADASSCPAEDRLADALDDATAEIDAYLGRPYSDPVPPILPKLCTDIAVFHLYSRTQEQAPEVRRQRYEDAVDLLKKINSGEVSLVAENGEQAPAGKRVGFYAV